MIGIRGIMIVFIICNIAKSCKKMILELWNELLIKYNESVKTRI
jgi:hypothetical protein